MRVWTNNDFPGHWPVGTAAVVVAETAEDAADVLNEDLEKRGLGRVAAACQFQELPTASKMVRVLCDGDY